jgi:hypothetical protein
LVEEAITSEGKGETLHHHVSPTAAFSTRRTLLSTTTDIDIGSLQSTSQSGSADDELSSVVQAVAVYFTGGFSRQASTTRDALHPSTVSPALVSTTSQSSLTRRSRNRTRCTLRLAAATATMSSQEAKLLSDFLLAPAPLRDFMTLRQFTDIFPRSHRENPAVKDLYRELHRLREAEIEVVRNDITKEVKRSRQLRRAYAQERRRTEDAHAAGIDPVALQVEEEVGIFGRHLER